MGRLRKQSITSCTGRAGGQHRSSVPSRAEPCRAREGPSGRGPASPRRQTHAGRSGAKRGGAAGYRLRCFHHDLTAWPEERGRGVPAGRPVPPRPQGGGCPLPSPSSAVLFSLHTCAWTHTCTLTKQCLMHRRCSKEPCPGHRRPSPRPQPLCHRLLGTGSAPAAAAGSCPTGSSMVPCTPSVWLGTARHSKGLPTAARCWGHRELHAHGVHTRGQGMGTPRAVTPRRCVVKCVCTSSVHKGCPPDALQQVSVHSCASAGGE